jgi:hypothetical protein
MNRKKYLERNLLYNPRVKAEQAEAVLSLQDCACMDCGQRFPHFVMDFDHREGEEKIDHIANMLHKRRPLEVILAEVKKCDVVCANCHRIRTFNRIIEKIKQ